jgi:hypothetical protein
METFPSTYHSPSLLLHEARVAASSHARPT